MNPTFISKDIEVGKRGVWCLVKALVFRCHIVEVVKKVNIFIIKYKKL